LLIFVIMYVLAVQWLVKSHGFWVICLIFGILCLCCSF